MPTPSSGPVQLPPNPVLGTVGADSLHAISGAAAVDGSVVGGNPSTRGLLACSNPLSLGQAVGAFGRSETLGVFGFADAFGGTGVAGNSNGGRGIGVHGHTSTRDGVLGTSDGPGAAIHGIGGLAGAFDGSV